LVRVVQACELLSTSYNITLIKIIKKFLQRLLYLSSLNNLQFFVVRIITVAAADGGGASSLLESVRGAVGLGA